MLCFLWFWVFFFFSPRSLYINLLGLWTIHLSSVFAGMCLYSIYKSCDPWTAGLVSAPDQVREQMWSHSRHDIGFLVWISISSSLPEADAIFGDGHLEKLFWPSRAFCCSCIQWISKVNTVHALPKETFRKVFSLFNCEKLCRHFCPSSVSSSVNALAAVTVEDLIKPYTNLSEKHLSWSSKGLSESTVITRFHPRQANFCCRWIFVYLGQISQRSRSTKMCKNHICNDTLAINRD